MSSPSATLGAGSAGLPGQASIRTSPLRMLKHTVNKVSSPSATLGAGSAGLARSCRKTPQG
ncbi:MAG: hypothetical protein LBK18_05540 [Prevotellaceae bacterium]|nr:hypothetical protein [Prevotellaceae bacterium]